MPMARSPTAFGEDSYDRHATNFAALSASISWPNRTAYSIKRRIRGDMFLPTSPLSPLRSLGPTALRTR